MWIFGELDDNPLKPVDPISFGATTILK